MDKNKNELNGILLIDKPKNWTSHDVVEVLKKRFSMKKIGHFGTLDPLATGLLVVGLGGCTKMERCLDLETKTYQAEVTIGITTDTLDITGEVLKKGNDFLSTETIQQELAKWQKTYLQTVPIYSAVKVNGKKLYEYARKKEKVELPKKEVSIYEIHFLNRIDEKHFTFEVTCSKGTYIRSLIRDIAISLKVPLTMSNLRRIRQGNFQIKDAKQIEEVTEENIYSLENIMSFETIELESRKDKNQIVNGNEITQLNTSYVLFTKDQKPLVFYAPSKKHSGFLSPVFFF